MNINNNISGDEAEFEGSVDTQSFSQLMKAKDSDILFNEKIDKEIRSNILLIRISKRLFYAVFILAFVGFSIVYILSETNNSKYLTLPIILFCGVLGGFIGIQRRLKDLTIRDLELLTSSYVFLYLSPLVGGVLAVLLYIIFLSGLLQGEIFPEFSGVSLGLEESPEKLGELGFLSILLQYAVGGHAGYAKLMFWCFVAGYSEKFVTDVIGRFEGSAVKEKNPTAPK